MNQYIRAILISLAITLVISLGLGFALASFIGFAQGTVLVFILQIVGFYLYSNRIQNKINAVVVERDSIIEDLYSTNLVHASCPCGEPLGEVLYSEIQATIFICDKCSCKFRVEPIFSSVLVSEPINLENAYNQLRDKGTQIKLENEQNQV